MTHLPPDNPDAAPTQGILRILRPQSTTVRDGNYFARAIDDRFEAADPLRVKRRSREELFAVMDSWGVDYIYECLANNIDLPLIAKQARMPVTVVADWWQSVRDPARELAANKLAASLSAAEADMVFDDPNASATAASASLAKARAEQKRWRAERKNPDAWGPPQPALPEHGKVSVNMYMTSESVPVDIRAKLDAKRQSKLLAAPMKFDPRSAEQKEADQLVEHGDRE